MTGDFDVAIVGAGFGGLYALQRMRSDGFKPICFEAGAGVGGTWYWNRYPGARVDIESMQYSYSFDARLQQDWHWPETFSAQPDLERYANHVADRFGLRDDIVFQARVDSMCFDQRDNTWRLTTSRGDSVSARFVIAATGSLNASNVPEFRGFETFAGDWYHTSNWPEGLTSFAGRRVAVIGTGSTGVQAIPIIAETADKLYVFQRTPAYTMPTHNRPLDPAYEQDWKDHYAERRAQMRADPGLMLFSQDKRALLDLDPDERERMLENLWNSRAGLNLPRSFTDTRKNLAANEVLADFMRRKIREIVKDPAVAEKLCPRYPIGAKRTCMDTGYYATFNRENVTLVDVRETPITRFVLTGLHTTDVHYAFDLLVLATGFDAVTGALLRLNATGTGGTTLGDKWKNGPTSFLGLLVAGFPNLFMVHGPGSPGVLAQMISGGEWQVDIIADVLREMRAGGHTRIDTTEEAERSWDDEVQEAAAGVLYQHTDSWYNGGNIPGKPRTFMIYLGGFDRYVEQCRQQFSDRVGVLLS